MSQLELYCELVGFPMNFSPGLLSREELIENVFNSCYRSLNVQPHSIFAPRPAFTNHVATLGENDEEQVNYHAFSKKRMTRTKLSADGGIVTGERKAVAFFTGDYPITALVQGDRLAVLHTGFRTLIREKKDEPNIIESAMSYFNARETIAWVGCGIGSCCWVPEYEDKPEVLDPSKSRHPELLASCLSNTTEKSPFGSGHISVDLYALVRGLLMEAGILNEKIIINDKCTCCAQVRGKPLFWSHTRYKAGKQKIDGRNMAIAFLVSDALKTQ